LTDGKILIHDSYSQGDLISDELKQRIDQYLKDNKLNQYGDPEGTMYIGGTPLFNEGSGESTDRYEHVLKKHPQIRKGEE